MKDPCEICELWPIAEGETECDSASTCPVSAMKKENEALKKKIKDMEYIQSWDDEIRGSDPGRSFW